MRNALVQVRLSVPNNRGGGQWHVYPPGELVQVWEHPPFWSLHSSMSTSKKHTEKQRKNLTWFFFFWHSLFPMWMPQTIESGCLISLIFLKVPPGPWLMSSQKTCICTNTKWPRDNMFMASFCLLRLLVSNWLSASLNGWKWACKRQD